MHYCDNGTYANEAGRRLPCPVCNPPRTSVHGAIERDRQAAAYAAEKSAKDEAKRQAKRKDKQS